CHAYFSSRAKKAAAARWKNHTKRENTKMVKSTKDENTKDEKRRDERSIPPSNASRNAKALRKPLSLTEVIAYGKEQGITASDAEAFYDSQEAGGWTRGGKPLRDWKASLRSWKANNWLASQRNRSHAPKLHQSKPDYWDKLNQERRESEARLRAEEIGRASCRERV